MDKPDSTLYFGPIIVRSNIALFWEEVTVSGFFLMCVGAGLWTETITEH